MVAWFRPLAALFVLVPVLALGQDGFGGSAGGVQGNSATTARAPRPEQEERGLPWVTKAAILSPGDRYEFKISVEVGDTLMASVTSDTFDPALELATPSGQVLAKNDDREDGDQSPFIAYHFDKAGEYTLKVVGYRSTSGGKFTISTKQFHPVDALPGVSTSLRPTQEQLTDHQVMLRIPAKKGTIYDLDQVLTVYGAQRPYAIIGPTGVRENDLDLYPTSDGSWVFRALVDGDYYCRFSAYDSTTWNFNVDEVRAVQMSPDQVEILTLSAKSILILEVPVKRNSFVRTTFSSQDVDSAARLSSEKHLSVPSRSDQKDRVFGSQSGFLWFRTAKSSDQDVIRLFQKDGTETIAVRNKKNTPIKFSVTNTSTLPELLSDRIATDSIKIGECKYYLMRTVKSDLLRLEASTDHFEPVIRIVGFDGTIGNEIKDPDKHQPGQDLFYRDGGSYLVQLSCDGLGGSGAFTLTRMSATVKPCSVGSVVTASPQDRRLELYSVALTARAQYQLVASDPGSSVEVIDEYGDFVPHSYFTFGSTRVCFLLAPREGHYRLWFKGQTSNFKFTLQPYSIPSLDR